MSLELDVQCLLGIRCRSSSICHNNDGHHEHPAHCYAICYNSCAAAKAELQRRTLVALLTRGHAERIRRMFEAAAYG